jgi:hypothetical protein
MSQNVACCPRCGSTSVTGQKKGFNSVAGAATFWLTGDILPAVGVGSINSGQIICNCLKCGNSWTPVYDVDAKSEPEVDRPVLEVIAAVFVVFLAIACSIAVPIFTWLGMEKLFGYEGRIDMPLWLNVISATVVSATFCSVVAGCYIIFTKFLRPMAAIISFVALTVVFFAMGFLFLATDGGSSPRPVSLLSGVMLATVSALFSGLLVRLATREE